VKVHVSEEEAFGTRLDVVGFEPATVPDYVDSVVIEVKIIGAPVNVRVNFGEPGLAKDKVVFVEGVEDRVERAGVVAAIKGDGDSV
jgi:hypothetical protein